jgi:hypothetical protein
MQIREDAFTAIKRGFTVMRDKRRPYWKLWRELAQTYLPYQHPWLLDRNKSESLDLNPYYVTSEGLTALRTQTAGLMNGITSPTRPWVSMGVGPDNSLLSHSSRQWLAITQQIMQNILARSNYYNVRSMGYFDLGLIGLTGSQMFEDDTHVIRLQRFNTGEFYVEYDFTGRVRRYAREVEMSLADIKQQFGEKNMPSRWQLELKNPISAFAMRTIMHVVERRGDLEPLGHPADRMQWREVYWASAADDTTKDVLSVAGYREQPATFPRWSGELDLGNPPAMDALADMRELMQLILKKGVGLEKMVDPPMLIDASLKNKPKSMMPGGYSYIPNLRDAVGARPAYQVSVPIQEMRMDINDLKISIREIFHNDLFKMISQLDTVRSATEIDARREEKLVLLSHFLERFENEQLDPDIERLFSICLRNGIFPDPPKELLNADLTPTYTSILSTAQRAIGTVPLERLLQMVGQVSAVEPSVLDIVNFDELIYTYGADIGAKPTVLRDTEQLKSRREAREAQLAQVEASATAATAIKGARELSQTDVGGGANALQRLLS